MANFEITRNDIPFVSKGSSPGSPVIRCFVAFARFQGYTPFSGELYWTVQSETSQDGSESATLSPSMEMNPHKGYAAPARQFYDRPNYIEGVEYNPNEEKIYTDSNPTVEQEWRTWVRQPNPSFSYLRTAPKKVEPGQTPQTTGNLSEPESVTKGGYSEGYVGSQYFYTYFDPSTKSPTDTKTDFQMIEQTQEGPYSGSLMQKTPFPASTEIRMKFYVYAPKNVDKPHLPVMIPLEAGFEKKEVKELDSAFLMIEIGRGTNNNMFIAFPYDKPPFMFHSSDPSLQSLAPDDSWKINSEKKTVEIKISDDKSKILLENDQNGQIWEFPDAGIVKKLQDSKVAAKLFGGLWNTEDGFYIPKAPLYIHHRGLKFAFNIGAAEYSHPDVLTKEEAEDLSTLIQTNPALFMSNMVERRANVFVSPPVMYTSEQMILPGVKSSDLSVTDFPLVPDMRQGGIATQVGAEFSPGSLALGGISRSGIPLKESASFYIVPNDPSLASFGRGDPSQTFGIKVWSNGDTSQNDVSVLSYRVMCIIHAVKPLPGFAAPASQLPPSSAYFRPKIYGVRTVAHTVFMPDENLTFETELSEYLQKCTCTKTHDSYTFIRTSYDLDFYVPQPFERYIHQQTPGDTDIPRRFDDDGGNTMSWEKLRDNPSWIKISHFWHSSHDNSGNYRNHSSRSKQNFIGMTEPSRSFKDTASKTTLSLKCKDLIGVLEQSVFTNSPFYDGMSVPYAIGAILERTGFTARQLDPNSGELYIATQPDKNTWFYVADSLNSDGQSLGISTFNYTLPYSGLFTQPLVQFKNGTKISDAIKQICQMFKLIFWTDRQGKYVLSIMPGNQFGFFGQPISLYSETNDVEASDSFYSMWDRGDDVMKFTHNTKVTEIPSGKGWGNIFHVMTVDKYTGNLIGASRTFPESIFDTESRNFKGMMTTYFSQKSALGGRAEANFFLDSFSRILSKPTRMIEFEVFGQDHLYPLEVVQIDENKIRIDQITHTFYLEKDKRTWMTKISGLHFGTWNSDVNIHDSGYEYSTELEVS